MNDIDPRAVQAMTARQEGRFDDALAVLVGLFARVCKDASFARDNLFIVMFEWSLLIQVHAPARNALARARDAQAEQLLDGDNTFRSGRGIPDTRFGFIADINEMLADPASTRALFVHMEEAMPDQARHAAWIALPALVDTDDFTRAERYLPDPLRTVAELNGMAASQPLFPPPGKGPRLAVELSNMIKDVRLCAATFEGLGRKEEAAALRREALARLENEEMRALAVRELAEPGAIHRALSAHRMALDEAARRAGPRLRLVQNPLG